jgi:hypothetical protein
MKYIAALLLAGGAYLLLGRPAPANSTAPGQSTGSDFLKDPLDRTHEVLKQARSRTQDPALQ